MGSIAAFNRARAQQAALQDAAARKPQEEAENMEAVRAVPELVEDQDELASPPYADADQLINVRGDSDLDREMEAMRQAKLNRERLFSREALDELQNSHLHEPKVKAIPDPDEMGKDRTRKGQKAMRAKAEAPYKDDRVKPIPDGRLRASEPETERPDGDTSVSPVVTNVDTFPMDEDDDPKFVEKMANEHPVEGAGPAEAPKEVKKQQASEMVAEGKEHKATYAPEAAPEVREEPTERKRRGRASQAAQPSGKTDGE